MSGTKERIAGRRGAPQDPAPEANGVAEPGAPSTADEPAPVKPPAPRRPRAKATTAKPRATKPRTTAPRTAKPRPVKPRAARAATTRAPTAKPPTDAPAPVEPETAATAAAPEPVGAAPEPTAPAPLISPAAPTEPAAQEIPAEPGFLARGRIRRRLRYLRRLREVQLRDIGGFALELHRHDRERPDLLAAKVAAAAQTDAELRALEHALDEGHPMREIREPGIGGACGTCGAVHGSQDRYCATCGEPLEDADSGEDVPPT